MMKDIEKTFIFFSIAALILLLFLFSSTLLTIVLLDILLLLAIAWLFYHQTNQVKKKNVVVEVPIDRIVEVIKEVPIEKKIFMKEPARRTRYIGHNVNKIFHKTRCMWAKRVAFTNLIKFYSENQARRKSYHRCRTCFNVSK